MLAHAVSPRERFRLDRGWRFHPGDINPPLANTHIAAYMNNKAGWARGAARGPYDDSDWRELDLPHDWSVEGPFDPANHLNSGYLPRGVGWYRRHFTLDETDRGRRLTIDFDGVATHCQVYVNGHLLHRHFCGYTPFSVDITDVATFGEQLNTIAVRVDATYMEGWWYEGAGIYRHVYLTKTHPIHIAEDGVQIIATPTDDGGAVVRVRTRIINASDASVELRLTSSVDNACDTVDVPIEPRAVAAINQTLKLRGVRLWSIESPTLYRLTSTLLAPPPSGEVGWGPTTPSDSASRSNLPPQPPPNLPRKGRDQTIDSLETSFGVRTIRFDADYGFFLNDQHVLLKGVCVHQDHAGVGVAVPDSIQRFRVQRLKAMGCNAVRPGHHPLSPEFMDACDELGVLVLGENRNFGSSPEHLSQLAAMIRRDRHRPSVVAWCLCNEEPIQTTPIAKNIARTMATFVRTLDLTRPITAAISGGMLNDDSMADVIDVMSINYQLPQHDAFHKKHPKLPVMLSETHCAYGTRGVDKTDLSTHRFAENDTEHAPWGTTAQTVWNHLSERPWLAGLFAWTGFDYRGEPSPHTWPSVVSHWGIMDLCGFEKGAFYQHRQWWTGTPVPPKITAGPAVAIGLEVHPSFDGAIVADGHCTVPVTVFALDAAGQRTGDAQHHATFQLDGPACIVGVGNGDPTSHEPDKAASRSLFNGLAQCLVQTTDTPGTITLRASAPGLAAATLTFTSTTAAGMPQLPVTSPRYLVAEWRMSPITPQPPDLTLAPDAADMNSWLRVQPGRSATMPFESAEGYAIYRATVKPPKRFHAAGARLLFHSVIGTQIALRTDAGQTGTATASTAEITLPAGPGPHQVALLVRGSKECVSGLAGQVELLPPE